MSGGHFDYDCFRIADFAGRLAHEIDINDSAKLNEFDDTIGRNYDDKTILKLKDSLATIELAAKLAKEIEWLYSGDICDETFRDSFDKIVDEKMNDELLELKKILTVQQAT